MTYVFPSVQITPQSFLVRIADGSLSKVTKIGSIKLSNDLLPIIVLYVSTLSSNLMSSKLIGDFNCISKFLFKFVWVWEM